MEGPNGVSEGPPSFELLGEREMLTPPVLRPLDNATGLCDCRGGLGTPKRAGLREGAQ